MATKSADSQGGKATGAHVCAPGGFTVEERAKMAGISRRMQQMADRVVDFCIPEIQELCLAGKLSIRDAYAVCHWPHFCQRVAMEKFKAGKVKKLADA